MAYYPYDRSPSGIVFFGASASDQTFESLSTFRVDSGNSQLIVPNIIVNNSGTIGTASKTNIITLDNTGNATFISGLIVNGDLTVQGSQVILNTETLNVEDNIILLNSNVSGSPILDGGIEIRRGSSTNVKLLWDEGNDYWSFTNNGTNYYRLSSNDSAIAGSGLTDGGLTNESRVIHVGAGTGIVVTANDINVGPELINGRTEITTVDSTLDYLLIWDATDSILKKVNRSNFVTGLGGMNSFTLAGDTGSTQPINDGNTVTISGGLGIVTTAQATDTVKIDIDLSEYSTVAIASGDSFLMLDSDGTTEQRSTVSQLGTYLAGTNVTAGGDGKLSVSSGNIKSAVFDSANFVDGTTVDFTVTAGASVTAEVKANSISETYLTASVAGSGIVGGNGTALNINTDNSTLEVNADILRIKDSGVTSAKLASGSVTEIKISRTVASVNSSITLSSDINLVTAGAGGVTVTLPSVSTGKIVVVKKVDSAAGVVTISGGAVTIDGASTRILYYQYETMTFVSDGSNWFVI